MKIPQIATIFFLIKGFSTSVGCPYSESNTDIPDDAQHRHLRGSTRPRFASLSEDEDTKAKIAEIIENQRQKQSQRRGLETTICVSQEDYDGIRTNISDIANAIGNVGDRGHFFGGIVRLAAHDFMDYHGGEESPLGSDGCIDFGSNENAGLPELWCDNEVTCPLKALYDTSYGLFMSRADFWVAAASAVIRETSINNSLILPFRWGRTDTENCPESSGRLPAASGCSEVQETFIERMGLTWTDAVALMGAHTLGRGDARFSGHSGTWVDTDRESTIFDKRFYTEVLNRSWRPRTTQAATDWTWGGRGRGPFLMLNTDICLRFDIPDGNNQSCCTDTSGNNCGGINRQCASSEIVRAEAFNAFNNFENGGRNDNQNFYDAFAIAWKKATENGSEELLNSLRPTCEVSPPPGSLSPSISHSPTRPPSATQSPVAAPPSDCVDRDSFKDKKKNKRNCEWVLDKNKCNKYGRLCPVSCNQCPP